MAIERRKSKNRAWRVACKQNGGDHPLALEAKSQYKDVKRECALVVAAKLLRRNDEFLRNCGKGRERTAAIFRELKRWTGWKKQSDLTGVMRRDGSLAEGEEAMKSGEACSTARVEQSMEWRRSVGRWRMEIGP